MSKLEEKNVKGKNLQKYPKTASTIISKYKKP